MAGWDELRDFREAFDLLRAQLSSTPNSADRPNATPSEGPDPYGNDQPEWLDVPWAEHQRTERVGDSEVHFADMGEQGERPALIFVHGLAGCWQNWLEQLPHFAKTTRVIAPDLPGFGRSPMPPWDISIERYARLIGELCDFAGVERAVLVGNSLGGFVTAQAIAGATTAGETRFEKLVLVSAAGISHAELRPEPTVLAARLAVGLAPLSLAYQEQAMRRPRLRDSAFRTVFSQPSALRPELLYEQYSNGAGKPGFLPAVAAVAGHEIADALAEVETPTLIVWGRDDMIVPVADAAGYASALKNSQTVIFDETGHVPMLERPVRFNRLLEAFVRASS